MANLPRYGPVGLHDPQQEVRVWLHGLDEPLDVTRNNVVAALRPFTIGVMLGPALPRDLHLRPLRLCMHERGGAEELLGAIHLRLVRSIPLPDRHLCLFEPARFENRCVGALRLAGYDLYEKARGYLRQRRNRYNFLMTPADIRCSHVFYLCPRPVVLVSVEHEDAGNLFPMDLIGPTDSPWYTMALRSTSPAVRLMQQSRRMALASVPLSWKAVAYELGKHHRKTHIDWDALGFPTVRSPLFGLRVPAAMRVREVTVKEFHEVGSHILFITTIESEELPDRARELQLFHSFSSYRNYLRQEASVKDLSPAFPPAA
jgi:flavin reductase (DIM6/NTAB) family NADH-FMN oxidoreductase RutF